MSLSLTASFQNSPKTHKIAQNCVSNVQKLFAGWGHDAKGGGYGEIGGAPWLLGDRRPCNRRRRTEEIHNSTPWAMKNVQLLYLVDYNFGKYGPINKPIHCCIPRSARWTIQKLQQNIPPPLRFVAALPCESWIFKHMLGYEYTNVHLFIRMYISQYNLHSLRC